MNQSSLTFSSIKAAVYLFYAVNIAWIFLWWDKAEVCNVVSTSSLSLHLYSYNVP